MKKVFSAFCLTLLAATILLFQNCGVNQMSSNSLMSSIVEEQNLQSFKGFTAPDCPIPREAECLPGQSQIRLTNAEGCQYNTCQTNDVARCPVFTSPRCPGGEVISEPDANGCVIPRCVNREVESLICPEADAEAVTCDSTEYKTLERVSRGRDGSCMNFVCRPRTDYLCRPFTGIDCPDGEEAYTYKDENDCDIHACRAVTEEGCPSAVDISCRSNEDLVVTGEDSNSCPTYECRARSQNCNQFQIPRCSPGQELVTRFNSNQCITYTCEYIDRPRGGRCPVFNNHDDCLAGARITSRVDINGCTVPVCEHNGENLFCARYDNLRCGSNEQKSVYSDGQCNHYKCMERVDYCSRRIFGFFGNYGCPREDNGR